MSSLIPGYTYDIFISYRQKDNKHDGWVTEFVDNLKGELESTFKEEISVYFDINPHDGLLETHDVDESLRDKLKCLIFIPIISRTYCDPKSFAWEHEFKAFIKQVSQEQFGLKVKLPNGNVANRIIPILIHELYPEDKAIVEKEIGGILRAIEFIYKEPGVNRPLTLKDNEEKNSNKTNYRNQVNKVANAIDDILHCLRGKELSSQDKIALEDKPDSTKVSNGSKVERDAFQSSRKSKKWLLISLSAILCIAGAFAIYETVNSRKQTEDVSKLDKSIAVLPFKLLSDDPDKQYLADGMMDAITLHLSKIKELRVMSRTSVEQYRGTTKTTRQIGKELNVNYLLEGSFQKVGDDAKLIVQLIEAGKESHVWANEYNRKWKDFFSVQSEVAQTITREMNSAISPEEKQRIEKIPTKNLSAYDLFLRARDYREDYYKTVALYKSALKEDSTFALVYIGWAKTYWNMFYTESRIKESLMDSCLILVNKALSYDDDLDEAYLYKGKYYNSIGNYEEALYNIDKSLLINPNSYSGYIEKESLLLNYFGDYIKIIENYNKALGLVDVKSRPILLNKIGNAYLDVGFVEKARQYFNEAFVLDQDSALYYNNLASIETSVGNYDEAYRLIKAAHRINNGYLLMCLYASEFTKHNDEAFDYAKEIVESGVFYASSTHRIGYAFWQAGKKKEAENYFIQHIKFREEEIKRSRISPLTKKNALYGLSVTYAFLGDKPMAYRYLDEFCKTNFYIALYYSMSKADPMLNSIRNEERFQKIMQILDSQYIAENERVRKWLEEQGKL